MIDNKTIAGIVKGLLATGYCVSISDEPKAERAYGKTNMFDLALNDKMGPFAMVIESAAVVVSVDTLENAGKDNQIVVRASLDYTHLSGGSNGSEIATLWLTPEGGMIGYRKAGGEYEEPLTGAAAKAA